MWYSKQKQYALKIEKDEDEYYVACVMELSGCHTQAKMLSMLIERIKETIILYLEVITMS
ncbi:type II toxin-antitoxin system HicB family antitoxin [Candidatus Borrarchaeum sp.]|uniref:type II toxin-antitoxin system HicB family antitoxin n=1 Tax=Candidatus Borrarchaeum sp. TaxID=2846742 RepID=UPI00257CA1BD|nr:type II toxin-antitoxin system HicB family antitoxin [Candidatus Borrarchaeum sp.]